MGLLVVLTLEGYIAYLPNRTGEFRAKPSSGFFTLRYPKPNTQAPSTGRGKQVEAAGLQLLETHVDNISVVKKDACFVSYVLLLTTNGVFGPPLKKLGEGPIIDGYPPGFCRVNP